MTSTADYEPFILATRKEQELRTVGHLLASAIIENVSDCPTEGWAYCPDCKGLFRRTVQGTVVGVMPFIFTWGLVRGVDDTGYRERWCYGDLLDALLNALDLGDTGEPEGYIRKATH